mmetsp:Transcript_25100/g.65474  ORF Transcript_25100/g.65474 Transcript_25100/m.65474 type:complete len:385 (+) Transcript_25100:56-1210(+)
MARRLNDARQAEARLKAARDKRAAEKAEGMGERHHMPMDRHMDMSAAAERSVSALGFEYHAIMAGRQAEYTRMYLKYHSDRAARWATAYPDIPRFMGGAVDISKKVRRSSKLKRFCRKGIPIELRPAVWMQVSGAADALKGSPGRYAELTKRHDPKMAEMILLDMHRTFPNNIHFRPDGCKRQQQLHRVLMAYAAHNPGVGYCQGMNFVCGMLLLVLDGNEEQTFWLFDRLIARLPPNMYASDMKGIQAECATFFAIMKEDYPELAEELGKRGALEVMPAIVVKWLINLFVDTVPEETVLRVWDALFYEDWKVLYRVGLAVLLMAYRSGELMTHDAATVLEFLSNIGWALYDCNAVFAVAFDDIDAKGKVKRARINKIRKANHG